ncbi:MAG: xylose isomerase [Cytophagaceae bacterium]|nr:xylose isomerase [Cytophagaceae bacterium]|tara:strand:- start:19973 stop:20956 length:984 start_codon:yes stop_codon:yes gene_type:complete
MTQKIIIAALAVFLTLSCKNETKSTQEKSQNEAIQEKNQETFFKISLAQWSLNEPIRNGKMNPLDFADKANELGFKGIEYVSQLYTPMMETFDSPEIALDSILPILKAKTDKYGIKNVLIMVDHEGPLSAKDDAERNQAVENHKKWVDAAQYLGCHSIRVNLQGADDEKAWKEASIKGLTSLADYAATKNINVIVENHGGFSSNGEKLMEVINGVNKENVGTLPDFGNFCMRLKDPADYWSGCAEEYDMYKGVQEMMPKAFGVSAKTFNFDDEGNETDIDFTRMLQLVKDAGYTGFVGIEYEGDDLEPEEGIILTRKLLIKDAQNVK